jgi:DNA-binding beta-propeller fold protein YncE
MLLEGQSMKFSSSIGYTVLCMGMTVSALAGATAQQAAVYASGLSFPSKVIVIPGGNLLVAEVDKTPNSGRVSLILPGGQRQTLIDGLPSGLAGEDGSPDGPNGLALDGQTLYIANGEGDAFVSGTKQGTLLPNPAGPSSPILASVLKVTFSGTAGGMASGFTLLPAQHFTLLDGASVTLTNAGGDTATMELLAQFRPGIPDAHTIYRNSHPYGLALNASQPDYLYVADAGMNIVRQVNVTTGQTQTLTRFAPTPDPVKGPPTIEAVPTSVHAYGSLLLVSLLSGAPFVPGQSRVMTVDPATGAASEFMFYLTSTIDVAVMPTAGPRPIFFSLEYSTQLSAQPLPAGQLTRYDTAAGYVYVDGLNAPSSMAVDSGSSKLYITDRLDGTVLVVPVI